MSNFDGDRSSNTEAESDSDVPDTGSGGRHYARRALSRVFIHLDKRVKAVPRKSALEKLKKAGRVKEIAFTRNHSAQEIERLLLANFPTLAGLDMSCLRIITSYDRGHSMKVVYEHVPSGNEIMEKFGGSNRKTVFLHWKPAKDTSPVSTNVITTQVQSNVTTVVCNITNTRTTSTVTVGPSQISTTAIGSNPATTQSGSTVHVGVPVPVSSSLPVQNSSVLTVAAHDSANAPTVGSPGSSFLATSAITTPSQVLSVTSTATTSTWRPRMSSRPVQSEASPLAPTNESDSDLFHSPFEDIRVVEIESDDQQDYLSARTEPPETVGTIKEDLCPLGTVDSMNGKVPSDKLDRIQEVMLCEKELIDDNLNQPLPCFLNLPFDEMCHQGRIDHHLMVLVVLKEGDSYYHVQRFLSLLGNAQNIYFWIAKAGSKSGRQVLQKFGSKGQETGVFILAPTSSRPNLVERFSGQTLENVNLNEVEDSIERGQASLQGLINEWERVQLRKDQELEFEQSLRIDKKKGQAKPQKYDGNDDHDDKAHRIREDRINRVAPEAKEGITIILRYGSLKIKRKFKTTSLFQEVYDWAGSLEALPLHFTIQRQREVVLHEHPITEGEVLDVYEREEENVKELLDSQVSFRGNVPRVKEDRLSATVVDEVPKEKPRKEKKLKERKIEKRASRESASGKRKASIRKKLKKLKKGKQRKREGAKKSTTLQEDSKQEDKETKEKVEDGKEIGKEKETQVPEQENKETKEKVENGGESGKEKETQVQEEKQNKDTDSKQENKEAKDKVEDEKEIGKEKATQVQEEKEGKGEDKEEQDTKNRRKRKKDKRTGSQRKKSKKE